MDKLIQFLKQIYLFLIFIILEVLAFNTYQDSSVYARGQLHDMSNGVFVDIHKNIDRVRDYFNLQDINLALATRNAQLEERLAAMEHINLRLIRGEMLDTLISLDSLDFHLDTLRFETDSAHTVITDIVIKKDRYLPANVINNSVSRSENYITLDRGSLDSVTINSPVVINDAVVGYIVAVSPNYSVAVSMLNIKFKTSGLLKSNGALCSVFWNGEDPNEIDFEGISRYSELKVGDTILTTGFSTFFTAGKLLGTVKQFSIKDQMYYGGKLKLFVPFDKLRYVNIIFPENIDERLELEDSLKQNKIEN